MMNRIIENNYVSAPIVVGMGATELLHSDRHAYTVSWVHPSGKKAFIQADKAVRTDNYGMSDMQSYEYIQQPGALNVPIKLHKDGHWRIVSYNEFSGRSSKGNVVMLGKREEYYDYSY